MESILKKCSWWFMFFLIGLLTACGGGGGSDSPDSAGIGVNSGVLVDPYIVGAQLQELSADGQNVIQSSAQSVTDASGRFSFANDFEDGSLLQINLSTKGTHAGTPFNGIIRRQVSTGDAEPIVVSPLTTLLANGMSAAEVIQMMSGAGLTGLTEGDLYTDPMSGLANKTGNISNADLVLLQANMSAYAFMEAIQDFNYDGIATSADLPVTFDDCVFVIKRTLNPDYYQQMAGAIGTDFTLGDLANTTVIVSRTVVDEIKQAAGSGLLSTSVIDQFMNGAMADAEMTAGNFYQTRIGSGSDGGGAPAADPANGESIVTANGCTGCHTIGTGSGLMELANDGSKLTSKFAGSGHKGISLSDTEISDVAAYLNTSTSSGGGDTPAPTGGDPANGESIVTANGCTGCHTIGTGSGLMELANDGSKLTSKFAGSGHKGISLSDAEISDVAAYLNTSTSGGGGTSSPPADTSCNSCHGYPPTTDAHPVHLALNGVDCNSCHLDNIQNGDHQDGWVDLHFPAELDAASGAATDNGDLTCSNIICHGGQQTPAWDVGLINVGTQCRSCHANNAGQYNDYNSGEHDKHVNEEEVDCLNCHDANKLANGDHLAGLDTTTFEMSPASSINSSLSYSNNSCVGCHHSERSPDWFKGD